MATASHHPASGDRALFGRQWRHDGRSGGRQILRVRVYIDSNLHRTIHSGFSASRVEARRISLGNSKWLLASRPRLRSKNASGESFLPPDTISITERNSLERRLFGSTHLCRLFRQAWSKSGQLATRARNSTRSPRERHGREYLMSDQRGKVLSFGPFELDRKRTSDKWRNGRTARRARHGSPHHPGGAGKHGRRQENPDRARLAKERSRTGQPPRPHLGATEGARTE